MLMVIGAVCFIVYELYKVFSAKTLYEMLKKLKTDGFSANFTAEERSMIGGLMFADFLYMIWTITGLFYSEWQLIAGIICGLSVMGLFLPKSIALSVVDGLICAGLMTAGVVYIAPTVITWPPT